MSKFGLLAITMLLCLAFTACGGGGSDDDEPTPSPTTEEVPTPSTDDLARSVVQVVALDSTRTPVWHGSGTAISEDGLILTNAHVVDDRLDEYDVLGVAVIARTDEPPDPSYLAEIVAVDYALDLAVIHIVADLDGGDVEPDLVPIAVGDSDAVGLGDHIRILGFPGIGGETITFTEGSVSGFTAQRSISTRAWIKTDATIAGGNSGGLAVNEDGEIIGVPTIVGSSEDQNSLVDCRYVVDTNRDGAVDDADNCVPVGGFINGLRPIALALPLIEAAEAGDIYISEFDVEPIPTGGFDVNNVGFSNLVFSDGVTPEDTPTNVLAALPTGATEVCGFWDYEGMEDGVAWEALWFNDGELVESGSITGETWFGGESGTWWVCYFDEVPIPEGLYELVLTVDDEAIRSDAVFVGGDHPLVDVDVSNQGDAPICYVFISPSLAESWGQDELEAAEVIEVGDIRTFSVPAGNYDFLAEDCDAETLAEDYNLDMSQGGTYTVS
jgi:serine protease Do